MVELWVYLWVYQCFFLICILCMLSSVLIGSIDNLKVTNRQYVLVILLVILLDRLKAP